MNWFLYDRDLRHVRVKSGYVVRTLPTILDRVFLMAKSYIINVQDDSFSTYAKFTEKLTLTN